VPRIVLVAATHNDLLDKVIRTAAGVSRIVAGVNHIVAEASRTAVAHRNAFHAAPVTRPASATKINSQSSESPHALDGLKQSSEFPKHPARPGETLTGWP
jgi:hypothetical protein